MLVLWNLTINQSLGLLKLRVSFFLDDVEYAVSEKYGRTLRFHQRSQQEEMNAALKKYSEENIKLKSNGKLVNIKYLGFEEDRESVRIYLESEPAPLPQKVEVATGFLYSLFDDQLNIIHVVINGKRQSHQLKFPDRYLSKTF